MILQVKAQHINGNGEFLRAAQRYRELGFAVVPAEGKDAFTPEWQKKGTPPKDDIKYWGNGHAYNIGLVLGKPSAGLLDIDRDCDLPNRVDKMFLPDTLMSGREERPYTHSWYHASGVESRSLYDAKGKKYLEVRADGCQTVVFPSRHPDDEDKYVWHGEAGNIATVDAELLTRAVNEYATALLLALHMPPVGSRHDYAMAAAGFLLRNNRLGPETVERILLGAWHAAGADSKRKTAKEVQDAVWDTDEKLGKGEEVVGGKRLDDLVENLPKQISKIWGWKWQRFEGTRTGSDKLQAPTHDELRDRFLAQHRQDYAFGLGEWQRYTAGVWSRVPDARVKSHVSDVVDAAKPEGIKPTASIVNSVAELAKYKIFVDDDLWDADPDILVCANGTLHIPTGELRKHHRKHYTTSAVLYAYDPDARAPAWNFLLAGTVPECADFLQEFAGYSLTSDTSHEIALWLYGPPGSGRSTFLTGLEAMLGPRSGILGLADLERSQFALANVAGKTLMTATEQPSSFLASTNVLNALISGETIQVEKKFKDPYEITPRVKLAWAMNELPRVGDANSGIFRRVKVVSFPHIPPEDRNPEVKERIKKEGPGILNWALEGLARLRERGHFEIPDVVSTATQQFKENNDVPALFIRERCEVDPDCTVGGEELYKEYKFWCEENGHRPQSSTKVAHDWQRLGFERYRAKGKTRYRGVRVAVEVIG